MLCIPVGGSEPEIQVKGYVEAVAHSYLDTKHQPNSASLSVEVRSFENDQYPLMAVQRTGDHPDQY